MRIQKLPTEELPPTKYRAQWDFTYVIYAGTNNHKTIIGTGNHISDGLYVEMARQRLINWVHDNDPRCDDRIDPLVAITSERSVYDCPICSTNGKVVLGSACGKCHNGKRYVK